MNIDIDYKLITEEDIISLETLIEEELPKDYKDHMLKYNGGSCPLDKDIYFNDDENISFSSFYPIKEGNINIEVMYNNKLKFIYPDYLTIGSVAGGYLCLRMKGEDKGAVYVYYSDTLPKKIANTFSNLVLLIKLCQWLKNEFIKDIFLPKSLQRRRGFLVGK